MDLTYSNIFNFYLPFRQVWSFWQIQTYLKNFCLGIVLCRRFAKATAPADYMIPFPVFNSSISFTESSANPYVRALSNINYTIISKLTLAKDLFINIWCSIFLCCQILKDIITNAHIYVNNHITYINLTCWFLHCHVVSCCYWYKFLCLDIFH